MYKRQGMICFSVFTYEPIGLHTERGREEICIGNPEHVQQPLIQAVVDHLLSLIHICKEVSWMPAYGPEQRGGTANVTVIVSDDKVSSPILSKYDTAIILNQPSLEKFENKVKPCLLYTSTGGRH